MNCEMSAGLRLRTVVFEDGERFPMLIDGAGMPHWYANQFITTQVRNASKAPNTMRLVLSAIRSLLDWGVLHEVDFEVRFARRQFLVEAELESIRTYAQERVGVDCSNDAGKVVSILRGSESARADFAVPKLRVCSETHYIRLTYIADFIEWYAARIIEHEAKQIDRETLAGIKLMAKGLRLRRPQKTHRSRVTARKGLTKEDRQKCLEVIEPGFEANPFKAEDVQHRNQIIVLILYHLGLRAGELLSLKVSDFNFESNDVVIHRRHGDKADPRKDQPVVKTIDRRLPLIDSIATLVRDYVTKYRGKHPRSRRHEFLLVTHQAGPYLGQPISVKCLSKIFAMIKEVGIGKSCGFSAHIMRHTANDRFSEMMDTMDVSAAVEEKMRSYFFGWKEGSGTASTYTRRHIEGMAREASLRLQSSHQKSFS